MSNETAQAMGLLHPANEVRSLAEKIVNYNVRGFRTRRLTKKLKFLLKRPDGYFEPKETFESALKRIYTFAPSDVMQCNPFNKGDA